MSVFGIAMNSNSIVPWIIAILLFFGGAFALRATWPRVQDAWGTALARVRGQPA
jgi:hypothetical protein